MQVAFRVDASAQIGTGHLVRCLSLAETLQDRGAKNYFVCRHLPSELAGAVISKGHELIMLDSSSPPTLEPPESLYSSWLGVSPEEDAKQTAVALGGTLYDWLVVDHYALDISWETELRSAARNILAIDDLEDRAHNCDLLLNQGYRLDADRAYRGTTSANCKLLLGPRYALLRDQFRAARCDARPRVNGVHRVLVFFGGIDQSNYTVLAIDAIAHLSIPDIHVDVVIGALHPHGELIKRACELRGFALHVQTTRMAELMAAADLAIGAGGTAIWERCCLGLPCVVVPIAENQTQMVRDWAAAGALYAPQISLNDPGDLARHLQIMLQNPLLIESLSRNCLRLADGRGALRAARAMGVSSLSIRPACIADADRLFEWRTDPSIRAMSHSTAPLDWASHSKWLRSTLSNPERSLLIGDMGGTPVGVVRFDVESGVAIVSIYMVPGKAAAGIGAELLLAAEHWFSRVRPDINQLQAETLGHNLPSQRLFCNAGYQAISTRYIKRIN